MKTTTYNTVLTIKRELNELSYSFFNDIVKKSPIKAVELEPGKWAFNDNEIGQGRNYFCDMFGYSLTQEEFEFEYFDDPQTLEDPEASESDKYEFYTQNGWAGSNYDQKLGAKEIAVKVRAFLKKEFPGFKFSVRSKWGMIADTLYITILSGPIQALCEGNPHSFESSISGFCEQDKGRITDEMLAVCAKIHAFVSSYRFSDSDGMIDYFDTNFYCWMNIGESGKPYQVVEPTRPTRPEKKTAATASYGDTEISPVSNAIEIVDYSEKAIAVFGDTKTVKDQLKSLGGHFNPSLKHKGTKRAGWIFSKKQADNVRALLAPSVEAEQVAPYAVCELVKNTALEELPESGDKQAINKMIAEKERAFTNASENAEFYRSIGNDEFADTEQTRANRLEKELAQLRRALPTDPIQPTGSASAADQPEPVETPSAAYEDSEISQNPDIKVFQQSDEFHKIICALRNNIAKGHTSKTIQKNCKALRELVHDPFFRSVTVPFYSKPQDFPMINHEAVKEFLRRVDLLAEGNSVEKSLSFISRYSSIYYTMEDIINEQKQGETPIVAYGNTEISPLFSDLEEKAVAAYRLQSREPEKRGAETLDRHRLQVTKDITRIPVNKRAAYLEKYEALLGAWLDAMARVVSPEVVGKAAFSKKRNEKSQKAADKSKQRLDGFRFRSLYRYRRKDPAA